MFTDEDIKNYQNDFNDKNLTSEELKLILSFFYSFGNLVYDFNNNKDLYDK